MTKIEIHDIGELIKENYPQEFINQIINSVLLLSLKVKDDYPNYRIWFAEKQIPGLYDNTRNIIVAHIENRIVGFVSLKKTKAEKKFALFMWKKHFAKTK